MKYNIRRESQAKLVFGLRPVVLTHGSAIDGFIRMPRASTVILISWFNIRRESLAFVSLCRLRLTDAVASLCY